MRAFVTGQIGVDKGPYLQAVKEMARQNGHDLEICHVGKMMYQEAPDVPAGRILNLPITRLNTLRRSVFKEAVRAPSAERARAGQHPRHVPLAARAVRRVRLRPDQGVRRRPVHHAARQRRVGAPAADEGPTTSITR
jgi:hypothetical protein